MLAVLNRNPQPRAQARRAAHCPHRARHCSSGNGPGGSFNHLGGEVGTTEEVDSAGDRMAAEGQDPSASPGTKCCCALQDKVWARDPDGLGWHIETHWSPC